MSTATVSPQARARILSPLHRLRGTIRKYIVLEALATFAQFLCLTYWIGMTIDFVGFQITGIDAVQVVPWWMRLLSLLLNVALVVVLVSFKLVRLLREFRPEALALLLERRFPKILGDRLITAVELSNNLDENERYGYSRAMILETVRSVSEKLDELPVGKVFNWKRLRNQWLFCILAFVGFFFLAFVKDQIEYRKLNPVGFGYRMYDTSIMWVERNVLLRNVPWPRRAQLEMIDFPADGDLRVGRDAAMPRLRVRALKWVVADRGSVDGWRPMVWSDLKPEWVGSAPPALPQAVWSRATVLYVARGPGEGGPAYKELDRAKVELAIKDPGSAADLLPMVDEVEHLLLGDAKSRKAIAEKLTADEILALEHLFEQLDQRAANPRYSRQFRKLKVPDSVIVRYWGRKTKNEMPLARQQNPFEFSSVLSDLKESVEFYAKGENYYTHPNRKITLVPPPVLTKLERDEYLPAYHYHRPPIDGSGDDLKGRRQVRLNVGTSLTGSVSRIDILAGSDLVLRGEVDKPLEEVRFRHRGATRPGEKGEAPGVVEIVPINADGHGFEKRFPAITRPIEFDIELTDADNVKSLRHIIIQPVEDRTPDVDVTVEVIRRTGQGYMCTPEALIPFSGRVRDDSGLARLDYTITYTKVESAQATAMRAAITAGVLGAASPLPLPFELFSAPALTDYVGRLSESREGVINVPPLPLASFQERITDRVNDPMFRYAKEQLAERLQRDAPSGTQIRDFEIKPLIEFLDMRERLPEMMKSHTQTIRPRYKMRLTVLATDVNVETGPRVGANKETFTFLVVPYEELLGEMAKDEESIGQKMADLVTKMDEAKLGIEKVLERMPAMAGSDEFRPVAARTQEIEEAVIKGHDVCQEIFNDYSRLKKEVETNRMPESAVKNKEAVVARLDEALRMLFPRAEEAHSALRKNFDERRVPAQNVIQESRQRQDELVQHLKQTLDMMGQMELIAKAARNLTIIISGQLAVREMLGAVLLDEQDLIVAELGNLKLSADAVTMKRGERAVVKVSLGRSDLDSRLQVTLKAPPESGLIVPPLVKVPRLAPEMQLELVAGNKTGEFAVELVPMNIRGKPLTFNKPFMLKVRVE